MATQLFANNVSSSLASGITNVATSLTLATGQGALFPSPTGGDWFLLTLTQATGVESSWEIVKVTARTTDTLTIVRAQESTTAAAWSAGAKAEARLTAGSLIPAVVGGQSGLLLGSDKTKLDALSGTNSGDNAVNSLYSGLVSNATHTGDVSGATILTLAAIITAAGPIGSASAVPVITFDAKGRLTAVSSATITPAAIGAQAAGTYATGTGTASGTNTGDETTATIKTKLGITTLSGANTGDQTIPTTLPASDVYAWAKAATKPSYTASEVGLGNVANAAQVTGVSGTAPVLSSGGTSPVISMAAATAVVNGYMTATYAAKMDGIAAGATNVTNTNQLTNGAGFITSAGNSATTSQRTFSNVRTDGINRGSYGAISISGSAGGYSGIDFTDYSATLMINASLSGIYRGNASWDWYWTGNTLTVGVIPWANVSGVPTSYPANDVYAWAKAAAKPTYTYTEVGAQVAGSYPTGSGTCSGTNTGDQTNISGNAATAGGLAVATGRNNAANQIVRTDVSGYLQTGYINSSNGNENNNSNADRVWGTNGSDDYLRTYRTSALSVGYAANSGSCSGNAATATRANGNFYIDGNYGQSIIGVYSSTVLQGVYAMGAAYMLTAAGGPGTLYGLAWSHPNAGGQAANLSGHGLLVMANGGTLAAISDNIWCSGQFKGAGTGLTGTAASLSIGGNAATSSSCSGNAASATTSGQVTVATGRTDTAWYNVVWNSGNYLYSPNTVQIRSSGYGAIGFNGSAWYFEGNASYGIYSNTGLYAAGGLWDAGNRVYSAGNPQPSVSGNSGSCTGNAATASSSVVFMSTSHAGSYWLVNNWTGAHWQITSNHGAGVRVAYADTAGSAPASDVYSWAKASVKPTYTAAEVGAGASQPFAAFGTLTAVLFH